MMASSTPPTLASMLRTATRTLPSSPLATSSRRTLTSSAVARADDPTSGVRAYVRQLTSSNSASNSSSSSSRAPAFRNASRQATSPSFAVNSPRAAPAHLGAMRSPSAVNGGAAGAGRAAANATAKAQAIRMAFHGQHYIPTSLTSPAQISERAPRSPPLLGPPKSVAVQIDQIHRLGLNPSKPSLRDDSYKNPALLAQFVTEMGRIMPRSQTMLTRKSQRQVGKAIRRMRSMGLMPVLARPQF